MNNLYLARALLILRQTHNLKRFQKEIREFTLLEKNETFSIELKMRFNGTDLFLTKKFIFY
jgi:hypothetical protein